MYIQRTNDLEKLIIDDKPYYILLDEIQMLDDFVEVLNSLLILLK